MTTTLEFVQETIKDLRAVLSDEALVPALKNIMLIIERDPDLDEETKRVSLEEYRKCILQEPEDNSARYRQKLESLSLAELRYEARYRFKGSREKLIAALLKEPKGADQQ